MRNRQPSTPKRVARPFCAVIFSEAEGRYLEAVARRDAIAAGSKAEREPLLAAGSTGQPVKHPLVKMLRDHGLLVDRLPAGTRPSKLGSRPPSGVPGIPPPLKRVRALGAGEVKNAGREFSARPTSLQVGGYSAGGGSGKATRPERRNAARTRPAPGLDFRAPRARRLRRADLRGWRPVSSSDVHDHDRRRGGQPPRQPARGNPGRRGRPGRRRPRAQAGADDRQVARGPHSCRSTHRTIFAAAAARSGMPPGCPPANSPSGWGTRKPR